MSEMTRQDRRRLEAFARDLASTCMAFRDLIEAGDQPAGGE